MVVLTARPGRVLDSVPIDMPRPRSVIGPEFERYRAHFVERLRAEVARAFEEQELVEMLDTRISPPAVRFTRGETPLPRHSSAASTSSPRS